MKFLRLNGLTFDEPFHLKSDGIPLSHLKQQGVLKQSTENGVGSVWVHADLVALSNELELLI